MLSDGRYLDSVVSVSERVGSIPKCFHGPGGSSQLVKHFRSLIASVFRGMLFTPKEILDDLYLAHIFRSREALWALHFPDCLSRAARSIPLEKFLCTFSGPQCPQSFERVISLLLKHLALVLITPNLTNLPEYSSST